MNKSFYFFKMGIKNAGSDLQSRVGRVNGNTVFFRPETEFRSTIAGGCTIFSLTKESPLQLPSVFSVTGHFKNFAQNQTCLICNKDDMA